jgi:hypothetical protein
MKSLNYIQIKLLPWLTPGGNGGGDRRTWCRGDLIIDAARTADDAVCFTSLSRA